MYSAIYQQQNKKVMKHSREILKSYGELQARLHIWLNHDSRTVILKLLHFLSELLLVFISFSQFVEA